MSRPKLQSQFAHSPVMRYGLAVASFAIALGLALLAQRYGFRNVEVPLFLFAITVTVWYAGGGPAILAVYSQVQPSTTSLPSPATASTLQGLSSRTILSSYCLLHFSPGSPPFGAASRQTFFKLATSSKSKCRNEPSRPACSISHMTPFSSVI
jgi:hypothetical protein